MAVRRGVQARWLEEGCLPAVMRRHAEWARHQRGEMLVPQAITQDRREEGENSYCLEGERPRSRVGV